MSAPDTALEERQAGPRGLWEMAASFPGVRHFAVRAEDGRLLLDVTIAEELVTEQYVQALEQWLDDVNPRTPAIRVLP